MTADQRRSAMEKALADLHRRGSGYVLFTELDNGDNYLEVDAEMRAEATHRRWPASKLPPLSPAALARLDRLGFKEAERNLSQSFQGWALGRMARQIEAVFVECYGCGAEFSLHVAHGE